MESDQSLSVCLESANQPINRMSGIDAALELGHQCGPPIGQLNGWVLSA